MELALFALLALVAVVSAASMIYSRNSVHSALFLILNFGCVALLFLMLDAPFISMVQIAVYAGAIMVLFLFVIMLLGAEQTTDTEARRLGWLPVTSTVLAALLLGALGVGMLATGSLDLPESSGDAPRLRFVNAANAGLLTISVDGIPVDDLYFGENSEFITLEAGSHDLSVQDELGRNSAFISSLENGQAKTVVIYGEASLRTIDVLNDFSTITQEAARLNVLNLYTEDTLALVELGTDELLNVGVVDGVSTITDLVVLDAIPYQTLLSGLTLPAGEHTLGIYQQLPDGTWDDLVMVKNPETDNWPVEAGTEQTIILSPDYNSVNQRPIILDSLQSSLIVQTDNPFGSPKDIGRDLFTAYLLPVNVVGFLLLVALVGVIVLTRPEILAAPRRSSINRRRKVSRPLVSVISQQTGQDVVEEAPKLEDPNSGD